MRRVVQLLLALLFAASLSAEANPAALLGEARTEMANRRFAAALEVLDEALAATPGITDDGQRKQATAAIRFYSALAAFGAGNEPRTRRELTEFFLLMPEAAALDSHMYDRKFVRLFSEVQKSTRAAPPNRFDRLYPGFQDNSKWDAPAEQPESWTGSPEMILLATSEERAEWAKLADDAARADFIARFWERRDPTPGDGDNELRIEFGRRRLFADEAFGDNKVRGALSDRGRVFVLLGIPQAINLRPLTGSEGGSIRTQPNNAPPAQGTRSSSPGSQQDTMNSFRAMEAARNAAPRGAGVPAPEGLVEVWIYSRDRLPPTVRADKLEFKFITEKGYGDHVLQREPLVILAMEDAARTSHQVKPR